MENQNFLPLSVYESGNVNKETIWFLHGGGGTHQTWNEIFDSLSNSFHLLSVNLPGHGNTRDFSNDKTIYIDDVISWFKQITERSFKGESFFLVGHSFGAEIALKFASVFPDRVKGLVLLDGAYIQNEDINADLETDLKQVQEFYQSYQFSNWESYLENEKSYYKRWSDQVEQAAISTMTENENKKIVQKTPQTTTEAMIRSLHTYPSKETYPEVRCPILLLRSSLPEFSNSMKEAAAERLVQIALDATVEVIPDVGHNIHVDAPQEVAVRIKKWIERLTNER